VFLKHAFLGVEFFGRAAESGHDIDRAPSWVATSEGNRSSVG
jgi:hypothetical protein